GFSACGCLFAQPNVLLILTDDQGYGDLSLHGNPQLRTPAMDRLGKESVRLDRFYVSPVCAPTRASLLTGRYHLRTGVFGVSRREEVMNPEEVTIAELFRANGYATGCFGKWHNGAVYPETPNGQGFDEFLGILGGLSQLYFNPIMDHNGRQEEHRGYITKILADAAMDWMDQQAGAGKPFFCYVPFNAPHTPGLVEDEYWKSYYNRDVGRWEAVIYGMIEVIDKQVDRMMEFLADRNLEENTIVIFMSDNGPATWRYNAGLRGKKADVYDGGIRVPCFIRWPGKLSPATIDYPLAHVDILPTLAEWCGLAGGESLQLDGKSFAALAMDPATQWTDRKLISFSFRNLATIRSEGAVHTNRWTAVMQNGNWELFDIIADVRQRHDLADAFPQVVAELRSWFDKTLAEMPDLAKTTPIPLSAHGSERVVLEGQDAKLPLQYKGDGIDYNFPSGISHCWISRWTRTEAVPAWDVMVIDSGRFAVSLLYCIPESDLGVEAYLGIQDKQLPIRITEAFDPPPNPQPFLLDGESVKYENKDWKELSLGIISLQEGDCQARIQVTKIPGKAAMEVKGVILQRL
ncbi:MAG TPA: arylsulfatase, partial [Oceanipulchritudo sp.]|nr:arylsulfatase [Oceanipulchritudo sp.]